jgi:hypothetical protein
MKSKTAIAFILTGLLLAGVNCQETLKNPAAGRKAFPAELAGTWQAVDSPWKIVLARNGTVSSALVPLGEVEIRPNKTTKVEMADGSYSIYEAGDSIVEYAPDNRELFITVEIKNIHVIFKDNAFDGNSIDRLVGQVSEDGKVWTADWIRVCDYGPRFPMDANDTYAGQLIFEKVKEQGAAPK